MNGTDPHAPYVVHKMDVSYFSGKLEAYLRYKGIPHTPVDADLRAMQRIHAYTGYAKVPAVETRDGLWLFDTTPTLQWFEARYPAPTVLPEDPALRFIALLLEDYGDEWLWRPAMWWRWVPRISRSTLGRRIATEVARVPALLAPLVGRRFAHRQRQEWLYDDGVGPDNESDVRDMLYREFEFLEPLFEAQPFLLGSHPSVADFGWFASMFRHFGNDPDSAEVMRRQAPRTYAWLARLWSVRAVDLPAEPLWRWPAGEHWQPLLQRIAGDYLPYLHQNACAFRDGAERFDHAGETFRFPGTKTTDYRVWCREVLQACFETLTEAERERVRTLIGSAGVDALRADGVIGSGLAAAFRLPRDPERDGRFPPLRRLGGQPRN